jgi:hypothetical protein
MPELGPIGTNGVTVAVAFGNVAEIVVAVTAVLGVPFLFLGYRRRDRQHAEAMKDEALKVAVTAGWARLRPDHQTRRH